jgi:hypothetical protein
MFFVSVICACVWGCNTGVLVLPELQPASITFVNVTTDIQNLEVVVDGQNTLVVPRTQTTTIANVPSGRMVGFYLQNGGRGLRRDTLFYTLGANASLIMFVKGGSASLVEFFGRPLQDTLIPPTASKGYVRFTHAAENTPTLLEPFSVQIFMDGQLLFPQEYLPGLTSPSFAAVEPGTYTFEVRDSITGAVLATKNGVSISAGSSTMIFTYDLQPANPSALGIGIF